MLYVSPEKYRTMGFGLDVSEIEDFELAAILDRAGVIAEGFCGLSSVPVRHSFLGGEVTVENAEQHSWRVPQNDFDDGQRRIYPFHWPVTSVTQFRVYVTNTQYVEIGPSEIFINNTDRYIEVISLAFTGVGLFGAIMPSIGLMKPVARLAYTYGEAYIAPTERLYPTDARTYRGSQQFWAANPAPVVYVNDVEVTTGFTIDATEGTVVFDSQQAATDKVTATYTYRLDPNVKEAVGMIGSMLIGEKELASKAMSGLSSLKVGEVTITRGSPKVSADNLDQTCPGAAILLAGRHQITIRG